MPIYGPNLSAGISTAGNTAGTTFLAHDRLVIQGGNNITVSGSMSANSGTVIISGANQTTQAQSWTVTGNTQATQNTTATGNQMYVSGGANITVGLTNNTLYIEGGAGAAGNTGSISAGTTRGTLGEVVFSNSNGVSFGINGQTVTASVAGGVNDGVNIIAAGTQTANTTGSVLFQNSNGITFGMSNSSVVTASHNGLTNINVSAGTTSNNLSAFTFSNGSGVSFGLNGSVITASVAAGGGLTNINISAGTTSNNLSALTFSNGSGVSFGLNGSVITASVAAAGGGNTFSSTRFLDNNWAIGSGALEQNSLYIFPHNLQNAVAGSVIKIPVMMTFSSSGAASIQRGLTARFGCYTRNATNSTILSLHYSTSYTFAGSFNSNVSCAVSGISAVGNGTSYNSFSSSSAGIALSSIVHGAREFIMPFVSTLPASEYWFGLAYSTSSAGAAGSIAFSNIIATSVSQNRIGVPINATNNGIARNLGLGTYSVTTGAIPNGISMTQINIAMTSPVIYFLRDSV